MNKQYVKEQIDMAIKELRAEYDAVIGNIYQCPDCGAVAFKNGEHICFKAAPTTVEQPKPRKDTLLSRVFDALPIGAPPNDIEVFSTDSPYNPNKIVQTVWDTGHYDPASSIRAELSLLWKAGKVSRRPAALQVANGKRERAGGIPGFVYWRTA